MKNRLKRISYWSNIVSLLLTGFNRELDCCVHNVLAEGVKRIDYLVMSDSSALESKYECNLEKTIFPAYFQLDRRKTISRSVSDQPCPLSPLTVSVERNHPIRFLCREIRYLLQP